MITADTPSPLPSPGARRPWFDIALGLAVAVLAAVSLAQAAALWRGGAVHGNDFKHLWAGAWLLGHGRSPYDAELLFQVARENGLGAVNPFVYLPTTGTMLAPLAVMRYQAAQLAWFWLNWALAWGVVLAGPGLMRLARPNLARLAGAAFLVGSLPFMRQMTAGQMNVVAAALIVWALAALLRDRPAQAGLALALAFGWKIAPAVLVLALWAMGRRRAAAWGAAVSLALLAGSVGLYGVRIHREAAPVLRQMGYGQSTWVRHGMDFYRDPFNQSPNAFFHHILTKNPYTKPWLDAGPRAANGLTWAVSLAIVAAWGGVALGERRQKRRRIEDMVLDMGEHQRESATAGPNWVRAHLDWRPAETALFLAATLAMLLLPSLMWDHYAVQALPALMWLFGSGRAARSVGRGVAALAILALLTIPAAHPILNQGAWLPVMSLRLWPMLVLFGWLLIAGRESWRIE